MINQNVNNQASVVIVGAGLSGLICGMRLSKSGFNVHIIEAMTYPGGLLATTRIGREYLELLPHHIRKTDRQLLSLIKEEGLVDKLEWFDSFWYGKASRKKLGYFNAGFTTLIQCLIQDITDNGGRISYSTTVSDISVLKNSRYNVICTDPDSSRTSIECDYLIYTGSCRSFVLAAHNLSLPINIQDQLMNITYSACISLMLVLKHQYSDVYFQNTPELMPFTRIVNHSNCVGTRNYGGNIVYLVGNCSITDDIWIKSDEEIMDTYFAGYKRLYPGIRKSDVKAWRLNRIRYADTKEYPLEDLTNPMENLYVCSNGLFSPGNKEIPLNRMEHVVTLAGSITGRIIEDYNNKQNSTEELS